MGNQNTKDQFYSMFIDRLRELYSGEEQLLEAIPLVLNSVTSDSLNESVQEKIKNIQEHLNILKKICDDLKESPEGLFSESMEGMIKECDYIKHKKLPEIVLDAAIISTLQKMLHYQIAGYGALKTFAKHLEFVEISKRLFDILQDKIETDSDLTKVAEGDYFTKGINQEASD